MSHRNKLYDPSDPRDAVELLNYLEQLNSDDEDYEQVNGYRRLDLVMFPPEDRNESDVDDATSDDNMDHGIRDIGKGILRQPMEVIAVHNVEENNGSAKDGQNKKKNVWMSISQTYYTDIIKEWEVSTFLTKCEDSIVQEFDQENGIGHSFDSASTAQL
ncbi:hypothetical protein JTB14_037600 [Gonioctena quinquepunctata]|nr:hypothetical protein JTB14_037600 [Gonioctena quinquepunctata]